MFEGNLFTSVYRETLSLEHPEAFFNYLNLLTNSDVLATYPSSTPEAIHEGALALAVDGGVIRDQDSLATIKLKLAMHAATPTLEAFYNYYEDNHRDSSGTKCGSWVDWYGEVICDVEDLARLVGREGIDTGSAT